MSFIVAVSGSPSARSRTAVAVDQSLSRLSAHGHQTAHIATRDLPPADLLAAVRYAPPISVALEAVTRADAVIVATPIYKAAYTGLLKAFLDLLPENALAARPVLPIATGGTVGHLLAIDYALRPVLTALGADRVLPGRFLLDADIDRETAQLTPAASRRLDQAVASLVEALPLAAAL